MEFMTDPQGIERKSMEIIAPHVAGLSLTPEAVKVYSRMIHASGDPQYAEVIEVHADAVAAGQKAIREGKNVYCDVEMVRTGIVAMTRGPAPISPNPPLVEAEAHFNVHSEY